MKDKQLLEDMVARLRKELGEQLESVVLYGPGARGQQAHGIGHLNLLIVATELNASTLKSLGGPIRWWLAKNQPWPRLFTQSLIFDALDVFPVEFLDILHSRNLLHGEDPLAGITLDTSHLRLQCERDLREKLMRLREGFVECGGGSRPLHELLAVSHTSLTPLWRACLYLLGEGTRADADEVTSSLCARLGIASGALEEVGLIANGGRSKDPTALFTRYLDQLSEIVARVDQFVVHQERPSP